MAENSQLSGNMKNSSTGTSSTDASSEVIGKHENEIVPHKISNHDKLVQTMVMVDGEWVNVNDTNDQANMKDDMNKVNKKVVEAQKGIVEAKSAADSAAKAADSAVSASVVNSDAITAQSAAISEAKSAINSAAAEIQQTAANAASDAAKIRVDVAQVQSEIDANKAANSASVEALKSDVSAAKQDIQAARQANENVAKQLDDYTKQAQAQGKTIKDIQDAQNGYTATLADVKGNVSKISDAVDGLSASLKDDQDNVATIKAKADELSATLTDHDKNIAQLAASAKELSSTLEDADGRLSKVEQTASTLVNEFADQQGHLNRVEQTAQGTQQTVANQQGQINDIKTDAAGIHETLTGQGNQIANINVTLSGLNTKYEGVSGDLGKLKSQAQWATVTSAVDLNNVKTPCHEFLKGTVTNAPNESAWWYLTVESSEGNRITQTVIADQSNNRYTRRWADGWSAWVRDATQTDVTNLSNQITTNSTQITQNQQAIALKADQSTVGNLSGEVSQNTAQLKVQAGQISSKVSSTDFKTLDDKVNGMQIGGRNYLRNSDKSISGWAQDLGTIPDEVLNSLAGKTITVSVDVEWSNFKSDGSKQNRLGFELSVSGSDGHSYWLGAWKNPTTASGKERVSTQYSLPAGVTFTVNNNGANGYVSISGTGKVSHAKIEVGNTSTDWTPAPEDAITAIQKNSTAIDQTNSKISLKADQTEVDQVKQTATQNSSRLNVMADEISSKVTSTDVNNIINGKGYATTSTVQSLITQKAGTINESITNLTSEMNTRNGVNLLKGTADFSGSDWFNVSDNGWSEQKDWRPTDSDNSKVWHKSGGAWHGLGQTIYLEKGDYTFSMWLWPNLSAGQSLTIYAGDSQYHGTAKINSRGFNYSASQAQYTWIKAKYYFTVTTAGNVAIRPELNQDGGEMYVSEYKLEKGYVEDPVWTPAPSDNATVTQIQSITSSIDGLQSTVANKADKSQITQLSNVIQSKVSTSDFTSKVSQLSNDINARVTKGDLLSQINVEAGRTLIQSNKIYFDADSFVMSPNSKAFIPSAFITNLSADKITTGTLDASKLHVKNFSADNISGGTLSGITVKAGDKNRYFQTSKDSIYWVHDGKTSLIGTDQYINPSDGISIADQHSITLTTWHGATINSDGSITNEAGNIGHPKIVIDLDGKWNPEASGGSNWEADTGTTQIGQWVADKEYTNLVQGKGFNVRLDDQNKNSTFSIQKDNCVGAYFGQGDHGNQINFITAGDGRGVNINGNFHVTGSKNSIVETKQGYLAINAYETAEYYFGDIGESNTGNTSQIVIGIDRIFNETVNTNIQYQVFVTSYSDAHVWVEKRYNNRFVVKSDKPGAEFGWELKAKRKGYESNRLRRVNVDFDQANIKGEN